MYAATQFSILATDRARAINELGARLMHFVLHCYECTHFLNELVCAQMPTYRKVNERKKRKMKLT